MGRWAHTLFGHDFAIGHAIRIIEDIAQGNERQFAHMLDKVLAASPLAVASFYAQDYGLIEQLQADVDESINRIILQKIDSGMGDEILEKYLAVKQDCPGVRGCAQYLPVVLAAILMEYGATIKKAHVRQLRDLVEKMQCNENAAMVTDDTILRGAGKRQFLAALDHYQAGKPRSFVEPSCHCCGKINADIKPKGKTLKKCGGCKNEIAAAWFCDKDCQRAQWKLHKPNCGASAGRGPALFQGYGKTTACIGIFEGSNV